MSIYYSGACATDLALHVCSDCETPELGGIRAVFFVKQSYTFTDPTDTAEWQAAIANKDIIVVPFTSGTYDGGKPKEGKGFGSNIATLIGYEHQLSVTDGNFTGNYNFWNKIKKARNLCVGFLTETKIFITGKPAVILPSMPVEEGLDSMVNYKADIKWVENDLPEPFDAPEDIFGACFLIA